MNKLKKLAIASTIALSLVTSLKANALDKREYMKDKLNHGFCVALFDEDYKVASFENTTPNDIIKTYQDTIMAFTEILQDLKKDSFRVLLQCRHAKKDTFLQGIVYNNLDYKVLNIYTVDEQ